jgi:hypothetical protein
MSFGERYLTLPDLFPARHGGEPWGSADVALGLPGGPYRWRHLAAGQAADLAGRFVDFALAPVPALGAGVEIQVFRAAATDFRDIELEGWRHDFDLDYGPSWVRVAGRLFMARLDLEPHPRAALWTSIEGGVRWCELAENLLRLLVAYRLLASGGVVLHSAGVVDEAGAWIFFGHSGAGKTTISRLSRERGRRILSDDLNALTRDGERVLVSRMPFAGDLGTEPGGTEAQPLRALCRLEQARTNAVRPLPAGEAVAALLACAPFVNHDPHRVEHLTAALAELVAIVPTQVLAFSLDADFWPCLEGATP